MATELDIIERIRRALASRKLPFGVRVGVGDDAAVVSTSPGRELVATTDSFFEGRHFLADLHPPFVVGYKSLVRAVSDVAAMGGRPRYFLLMLALPLPRTGRWLNEFLAGLRQATTRIGIALVGGDILQNSRVAIAITVLGDVASGRSIRRDGASPGDLLCVSGTLGAAQLGLEVLERRRRFPAAWQEVLRPHFFPPIRVHLGQWLAGHRLASAMIDISDGLSTDLGHLCRASRIGARVWLDRLPAVRIPDLLRRRGFDPIDLALHGGDDYELLFTVPRRLAGKLTPRIRGVRVAVIGEMTRDKRILTVSSSGQVQPLRPRGWDHFRGVLEPALSENR